LHLNLPAFKPQIKEGTTGPLIFDSVRMKWVSLSNEEWVRQHIINYLIEELKISKNHIAIERLIAFNGRKKRFDICVYNNEAKAQLLIECKAFDITLSQQTIHQILTYHQSLPVSNLWISNGLQHLTFQLNEKREFEFRAASLIL
jgi:hypothetical protein